VSMTSHRYFVLRHAGEWKISLHYAYYGPYRTRREAINTAINWAHLRGCMGDDTQVVIHDDDQFEVCWTYGKDPYPPKQLVG
jgi:hypothetical protein